MSWSRFNFKAHSLVVSFLQRFACVLQFHVQGLRGTQILILMKSHVEGFYGKQVVLPLQHIKRRNESTETVCLL